MSGSGESVCEAYGDSALSKPLRNSTSTVVASFIYKSFIYRYSIIGEVVYNSRLENYRIILALLEVYRIK